MRAENTALAPRNLTKKSRGLIRSLNRSFVRDDKSPRSFAKPFNRRSPLSVRGAALCFFTRHGATIIN
jgi:hypothetical protein